MKSIFFKISVVLAFCFGVMLTQQSVYAQCPFGWTYEVRPYTINGCTYNVTICYKCSPTGANPATVKVLNIDQNGCPPVSIDDVMLAVISDYHNLCSVQPCGGDCSLQMSLFIEVPSCWQWYYNMNLINGQWRYYAWREPCSERTCGRLFKVCFDQLTGKTIVCPGWDVIKTSYGAACPNTNKIPWPEFFDPATMHYNVTNEPWGDCYEEYKCTY